MVNYNVELVVSDFLTENKVDTAFGVVSVHNIPMLNAIAKTKLGIKFVPAKRRNGSWAYG